MQNEKIIQAIAAYLEKESCEYGIGETRVALDFGIKNQGYFTHAGFCQEIATELAAAIAPHLESRAGWEDAPSWAEWRTVDDDGTITYWNWEPYQDFKEKSWTHQNVRVEFEEIKYHYPNWKDSLQQRPK